MSSKNNFTTPEEDRQIEAAFQEVLDGYLKSNHRKKVEIIERAFAFAKEAHKGIRRRSGEPYILHPIAVAKIASQEIGLGSTSICAALLHDVVEDTEFRMASFAVEIKASVLIAVKFDSPTDKLTDLIGRSGDHLAHSLRIGEPVAGNHRVPYMLVEVIHFKVSHRSHSALCERRVGFIERGLAHERHLASAPGSLEREAHAGYARTDH